MWPLIRIISVRQLILGVTTWILCRNIENYPCYPSCTGYRRQKPVILGQIELILVHAVLCDYFWKKKCIVLELFILNIPFKVLVINSHNNQGHECHSEHLKLPWSSHLLTFIFGKISFCTWYLNRHFHPVRSFKYYFLPLMIIFWNVYFKGSWNCSNGYIMNFVIYIMSIPLIHSLNPTALRMCRVQ